MRPLRLLAATAVAAALILPAAPALPAAGATPAQLVRISAEHHKGYDRVLFWFDGAGPTDVRIAWSATPPTLDPSGLPSGLEGNAFLSVAFETATGFDDTTRSGTSYGRTDRAYDLANVTEVTTLGDYEAVLSFGIGTMHRSTNVHVHELTGPTRVAIDIGTWFDRVRRTIWFADASTFDGDGPYLVAVDRAVPLGVRPLQSVAHRLFAGPTQGEKANGLELVRSGAKDFTDFSVNEVDVARLRLTGGCQLGPEPISIGTEITRSLKTLVSIDWVKIYDPDGETTDPDHPTDSLPACLIP